AARDRSLLTTLTGKGITPMTSDDLCPEDDLSAVATELADIEQRLTAPRLSECLRCYLLRMITEFGCDGTYRWTICWRDVCSEQPGKQRAEQAGGQLPADDTEQLREKHAHRLLRRLADSGGFCDCEVLLNVYPDYPPGDAVLPCAGAPRPGSARPCNLRQLRKSVIRPPVPR